MTTRRSPQIRYNAIQQQPQQQQEGGSRVQMADDVCKNNNVTEIPNRFIYPIDNNHLSPGEINKCDDDRKQIVDLVKGISWQKSHNEQMTIHCPVTCNITEMNTEIVFKTVKKINKYSICNITSEVEVLELFKVMEKEDYVSQGNVESETSKIWQMSTSADIENEEYETPELTLDEHWQLSDDACEIYSAENNFLLCDNTSQILSEIYFCTSFIPHSTLTVIWTMQHKRSKQLDHDSWKHIFQYWLEGNCDNHCIPLVHRASLVFLHSKVFRTFVYYSIDFGEIATEIFKSGLKGKHKDWLFLLQITTSFDFVSIRCNASHTNRLLQERFSYTTKTIIYMDSVRENTLTFWIRINIALLQSDNFGKFIDEKTSLCSLDAETGIMQLACCPQVSIFKKSIHYSTDFGEMETELFKSGIKSPPDIFKRWIVMFINFKNNLHFIKISWKFSTLYKHIKTKLLQILHWNTVAISLKEREQFVKPNAEKFMTSLLLLLADMKRSTAFDNLYISMAVCYQISLKEHALLLIFVHHIKEINDFQHAVCQKYYSNCNIIHHHSFSGGNTFQTSRYFSTILKYYWQYFKNKELAFCTDQEYEITTVNSSVSFYLKKFTRVRCLSYHIFSDVSRPIGKGADYVVVDGMPPKKFTSSRDTADLQLRHTDHLALSSNVTDASLPPGISSSGAGYNSQHLPSQLLPDYGNRRTITGTSTSGYFSEHLSHVMEKDHAIAPAQTHFANTQPPVLQANLLGSHLHAIKNNDVSKGMLDAQIIKDVPKEIKQIPGACPQYDYLYDTKFDDDALAAHQEVKHKSHTTATTLKDEPDNSTHETLKPPEVNYLHNKPRTQEKYKDTPGASSCTKTGSKQAPFPKRSCVVVGNKQFTLTPSLLAHPHMDHYFVKERTETRPGHFLARLVLHHEYLNKKHGSTEEPLTAAQQSKAASIAADKVTEKDGGAVTERKHFPLNVNRLGYIVFSSDLTRFSGSTKYPLPSKKAVALKVGKGGNGIVFLIFHSGKEYAVKKTVYRANEIRIHSQLDHPNLVNLDAVLVGEEHERHRGKFYAFCFMTKCDMDLRSVISTKQHGCLKHLKMQLVEQHNLWEVVVVNIKYILRSLLKALEYMHNLGLVHRDVKASNILLKMQCPCTKPLMCSCPQKYLVKLTDFDSSTIVPGFGLKIEPHQMIRYASVLPLGTMGYRAPEVSMHLVISGPYEVLYTTAVDIWSFGCLLLNMLIGKNGPLKQRGEASLLLSAQEQPYSKELFHKIIKVNEVQKYYSDMPEFVDLVYKCLQVDVHCRPSARQLLQLDIMQSK